MKTVTRSSGRARRARFRSFNVARFLAGVLAVLVSASLAHSDEARDPLSEEFRQHVRIREPADGQQVERDTDCTVWIQSRLQGGPQAGLGQLQSRRAPDSSWLPLGLPFPWTLESPDFLVPCRFEKAGTLELRFSLVPAGPPRLPLVTDPVEIHVLRRGLPKARSS